MKLVAVNTQDGQECRVLLMQLISRIRNTQDTVVLKNEITRSVLSKSAGLDGSSS